MSAVYVDGEFDIDFMRIRGNGAAFALITPIIEGTLLPSAVPLPAALPLLMSALGFFGFLGWRRKRMAAA